jgi:hypothetical protein
MVCETCPSIVTVAPSPFVHMITFISALLGIMIGRFVSVKAHMGFMIKESCSGKTIGPPAEREYAVEPVGVDMIIPSALKVVRYLLFTVVSRLRMRERFPRVITTSFRMLCSLIDSLPRYIVISSIILFSVW